MKVVVLYFLLIDVSIFNYILIITDSLWKKDNYPIWPDLKVWFKKGRKLGAIR
jgi:hypothetical protein